MWGGFNLLLLSFVVGVSGRDTVPEIWRDLRWRLWPEGEGASLGRETVESAEDKEREVDGWTEGADETEEKGVWVEHDTISDQRSRDETQVLHHRQRQYGPCAFRFIYIFIIS